MMSSLALLEQHVMSGEDSGAGGSGQEGGSDGHNGLYPDGRVRSLTGTRARVSSKAQRFKG